MKVVEKDSAVLGLLEEEYQRCQSVLAALVSKVSQFPKGSLHARKKEIKGKEYVYHYLVAREQGRVINKHIPEAELSVFLNQIEKRKKYQLEMQVYKKRISYLEKLLNIPRNRGRASN